MRAPPQTTDWIREDERIKEEKEINVKKAGNAPELIKIKSECTMYQ